MDKIFATGGQLGMLLRNLLQFPLQYYYYYYYYCWALQYRKESWNKYERWKHWLVVCTKGLL